MKKFSEVLEVCLKAQRHTEAVGLLVDITPSRTLKHGYIAISKVTWSALDHQCVTVAYDSSVKTIVDAAKKLCEPKYTPIKGEDIYVDDSGDQSSYKEITVDSITKDGIVATNGSAYSV